MKKLKLNVVALLLVVTIPFVSCSLDDDSTTSQSPQTYVKKEFVTEVTGPETGTINQEVLLTVTFAVGGDCGEFDKVFEITSGNTKTIELQVKYDTTKVCAQPTTQNMIYKFKATAAGTYVLKFKKSETEFITQTIVVS